MCRVILLAAPSFARLSAARFFYWLTLVLAKLAILNNITPAFVSNWAVLVRSGLLYGKLSRYNTKSYHGIITNEKERS